VLDEARVPAASGYKQATAMAVELVAVMANAAVLKLHDPELALSNWLTSQDGKYAIGKQAVAHAATLGARTVNDAVESNFGVHDNVVKTFGTICPENASGITQQRHIHDFAPAPHVMFDLRHKEGPDVLQKAVLGLFGRLFENMQESLVEMARRNLADSRTRARHNVDEQKEYKKLRRLDKITKLLNATIDYYANGLELFDAWKARGAKDAKQVDAQLSNLGSEAAKVEYLRNEIEMRVVGLGWQQFRATSLSTTDTNVCISIFLYIYHI